MDLFYEWSDLPVYWGLQRFCNTSVHGCQIEEILDEVKSPTFDLLLLNRSWQIWSPLSVTPLCFPVTQCDSNKLLSVFPWPVIFIPEITKLHTEYESVTQKVLFGGQWNFFTYTFIFLKQFYFILSGVKIMGHGNPDNNLESLCIICRRRLLVVKVWEIDFTGWRTSSESEMLCAWDTGRSWGTRRTLKA
jgi:hypothetical protein